MDKIPNELRIIIYEYLDLDDLLSLRSTNHKDVADHIIMKRYDMLRVEVPRLPANPTIDVKIKYLRSPWTKDVSKIVTDLLFMSHYAEDMSIIFTTDDGLLYRLLRIKNHRGMFRRWVIVPNDDDQRHLDEWHDPDVRPYIQNQIDLYGAKFMRVYDIKGELMYDLEDGDEDEDEVYNRYLEFNLMPDDLKLEALLRN